MDAGGPRERLLAAAAELFAERGYAATNVERITRRAGLAKESFYRCFVDREACYLALFDRFAAEAQRRAGEAWSAEPGEWPAPLEAALAALLALAGEQPEQTRACLSEPLVVGPAAVERYEVLLDRFAACLREGRPSGPRPESRPASLERTVVGGIAWSIAQRLAAGEAQRLPDLLPEATRLLQT